MSKFTIRYRDGAERVYRVNFSPWPTWHMLNALAEAMLRDKGGKAVEFIGPNGLHGFITRKEMTC